jgi:hypothetical protein
MPLSALMGELTSLYPPGRLLTRPGESAAYESDGLTALGGPWSCGHRDRSHRPAADRPETPSLHWMPLAVLCIPDA